MNFFLHFRLCSFSPSCGLLNEILIWVCAVHSSIIILCHSHFGLMALMCSNDKYRMSWIRSTRKEGKLHQVECLNFLKCIGHLVAEAEAEVVVCAFKDFENFHSCRSHLPLSLLQWNHISFVCVVSNANCDVSDRLNKPARIQFAIVCHA